LLGVFLDTETNGLNPFKHKILEIAFKIIDIETGFCSAQYEAIIALPQSEWGLSDPDSIKVNGFSWDLTKKGRSLSQVAEEIKGLFTKHRIVRGEAVFICQNPSFDRAFFHQFFSTEEQEELRFPYHWLDLASMFWAISIVEDQMPWTTGYSKDKIAAAYHLPPEKQPHRAMNGVVHLLQCYEAVVGFPKKFS
jgi:DNA polymerase-3 subunit epsilon/oligoribonuclease